MANNKIIKIAKNWNIKVGETTMTIGDNEDYRISLSDGTTRVVTIAGLNFEDSVPTGLKVALDIEEGSFNPIDVSDEILNFDNIDDVERVHVKYNRTRRNVGNDGYYWGDDPQYFTFILPGRDGREDYRITVAKGEFIALAVRAKDGKGRTLYGEITDVDDNGVIHFRRYLSNNSVRSILPDYKVNTADLRGVYHYEILVEDYTPKQDDEVDPAE